MDGDSFHFLDGGGAMAAAIADFDWSVTPMGPIRHWPAALKVTLSIVLNSAFPKALCWGPGLITFYNDAFVPILGEKHPCLGRPFGAIWTEAWHEIGPISDKALAGQSTYVEDFPLTINRRGTPEKAYFTFCYSPVRDESGQVVGMLDTVMETTGKVHSEHLARLRNRELIHRSQNTLAVLSAMISQTHRHSSSLEEAQVKAQQRLSALSRAQDVLGDRIQGEAELADIVRHALSPFAAEGAGFEVLGPPVRIDGARVTTLSLALHELATNASKYGALSTPEGKVTVEWRLDPEAGREVLTLEWIERGGPPPVPPERTGFGTFLVLRALPQEFGGAASVDYPDEGVRLRLTAPLDRT